MEVLARRCKGIKGLVREDGKLEKWRFWYEEHKQ